MNKILKNNTGDSFEVIFEERQKIGKRVWTVWTVRFLETGTVRKAYRENAIAGKVRDPYKASFLGVGYSGDHRKPSYWKQAKRLWSNMLKRCYDPNYEQGYFGRGYTVSARWLCFANFLEDIAELENFDKWLEGFKEGSVKYNLDKDLKVKGNKVYDKAFCGFVPESINKAAGAKNGKPYTKKPKKKIEVGKA